MRNFSLALENIAESAVKAIAAPSSSDSLAKVILDNRITFDYLLAEQGDACCGQHHLLYLVQHYWGSLFFSFFF